MATFTATLAPGPDGAWRIEPQSLRGCHILARLRRP
jgi:hypothetical protein